MIDVQNELVVLLDESYRPIESALKSTVHTNNTPLHLAFSCYIFDNEENLLITQRAHSKKVWPSVWTNSFCGHPLPTERMEDAIERRALFELGVKVSDITVQLPNYKYTTPPYNGIIENEFCPVYFAKLHKDTLHIQPNRDEVEDFTWISVAKLKKDIQTKPDIYSYWLKDQLVRMKL